MAYHSEKPANIISTNSMFILDEHADLKTTQVGGTLDFCSSFDNIGDYRVHRFSTHLYFKVQNDVGNPVYVCCTIGPEQKALLFPMMTDIKVDKNGKVINKFVDYSIYIANVGEPVTFSNKGNAKLMASYYVSINDSTIEYMTLDKMILELNSSGFKPYKIVDKIEVHDLYSATLMTD